MSRDDKAVAGATELAQALLNDDHPAFQALRGWFMRLAKREAESAAKDRVVYVDRWSPDKPTADKRATGGYLRDGSGPLRSYNISGVAHNGKPRMTAYTAAEMDMKIMKRAREECFDQWAPLEIANYDIHETYNPGPDEGHLTIDHAKVREVR